MRFGLTETLMLHILLNNCGIVSVHFIHTGGTGKSPHDTRHRFFRY